MGIHQCLLNFKFWQTGSGKTHTMLGDISDLDHQPSDNRGMTPRVFESLFTKIQMVFPLPSCLVVDHDSFHGRGGPVYSIMVLKLLPLRIQESC